MIDSEHLTPLPDVAQRLCEVLAAPRRLTTHLVLVHDCAFRILDSLPAKLRSIEIDREAVLFGAATHDLGKTMHPDELTGPGNRHEDDGPELLQRHGVTPNLARFARTHGRWQQDDRLAIEDLLVALADHIWKGSRCDELETRVANEISIAAKVGQWEAFAAMDEVLTEIAAEADGRLAWQQQ